MTDKKQETTEAELRAQLESDATKYDRIRTVQLLYNVVSQLEKMDGLYSQPCAALTKPMLEAVQRGPHVFSKYVVRRAEIAREMSSRRLIIMPGQKAKA